MAGHRSRSFGLVVVVLIAVVAVIAGGAGGLWIGLSRTPNGLAAPLAADTFAVATAPFDDAHQVNLEFATTPGLTLVAHTTGVITDASCQPGGTIESGSVPWQINGAPVLALATASPFYRDFKQDAKEPGTKGLDVAGLQQELARLGLSVDKSGEFDKKTAAAVTELLTRANIDAAKGGLPLAHLVWLPDKTVTTASCQVVLGGPVTDGAPLAMTAPTVTGLAISPIPHGLLPGDRTVTVGGVTVPVGADGQVTGADAIGKILGTGAGKAAVQTVATDHPVQLSGTLALADPITAATVPATAVAGGAGATCVFDTAGKAHPVDVVDSSLGRSVVKFTDDDTPDRVRITPESDAACG